MSDLSQVENEVTPATTTENVETTQADTEATGADEQAQVEERKFSQQELDSIIQKEKAKAEAKAERRASKAYQETLERLIPRQEQHHQQDAKPSRAQYADEEQFIDALTDWKLEQRDRAAHQGRQQEQLKSLATKTESLYQAAEKLPGFDREVFEELSLTKAMAQTIIDSDIAPKLMAYLSANPAEVDRIGSLSHARQAAELGKLEAKVASTPVKTTKVGAPINPIGANGHSSPTRLDSAKSVDEMINLMRKNGSRWVR